MSGFHVDLCGAPLGALLCWRISSQKSFERVGGLCLVSWKNGAVADGTRTSEVRFTVLAAVLSGHESRDDGVSHGSPCAAQLWKR